ncbi:hypothetical protein GGR51DRAFT_486625 [Nemania sp. FL0031]|nr:hypothetical protein GGR51DRAFT_486625 [Nemania sp. FL0031]
MLQQLQEDEANNEDTRSSVSASSYLQVESEDSRLHLPSLADLRREHSDFECPFCRGIQTFAREQAWRRHAYRDLKACVCALGGEKCDSEMFGDSHTWFNHELLHHRKQWVCVLCPKGPFGTMADFKSHMKNTHSNVSVNDGQLEIFMNAGQRPVDVIAAAACPFCDEWETTLRDDTPVPPSVDPSGVVITVEPAQFRRHVASHMEQLALFAIPRSMDDDESEGGSNRNVELSRSTVNAELQSSTPQEPNASDEWVPDPPLHVAAASGDVATFRVLLEKGADIHLRGETWRTVEEAALSCRQPTRADILNLLRNHSDALLVPDITTKVERDDDYSTTPSPVTADNQIYETDAMYKCSDCGHIDTFVYSYEDDSCCKECGHRKCGDCVAIS